jgi:hypothetical protein
MAISGPTALRKYKKLFDKIGTPEGTCKIVIVNEGASKFGPAGINAPISLGKAIIDDLADRGDLVGGGLMTLADRDTTVVKIWGAAIEASGLYQVTEDALRRAKLPGGGLIIYDRHYALINFHAGFRVGDYAMTWILACVGERGLR